MPRLVVTRRPWERLKILDTISGRVIYIGVSEIGRGRVRVFVEADREVRVLRAELEPKGVDGQPGGRR
jgi:sRNA-binding carbon storage regulator CsrA